MSGPLPAGRLTVVVLTYNEEGNLPACLAPLQGMDCDLLVVDSGSTDRTLEIARQFGARVLSHPFTSHTDQWRWALGTLSDSADWVLGLDADQRLSPELRAQLARLFWATGGPLARLDGVYLNRRQIFRGTWIRHGGYYPKYLLKLFRRTRVHFDDRDLIDHHFHVSGPTAKLRGDLIEANVKEQDIAFWIEKHNRYARLHAREELLRRQASNPWSIRPSLRGNPDQRTAWLKDRWYQLPLYVRPSLYFFIRYVLRRGFLDGKQGFIFHFLHGFWYRLLVDIHLDELLRQADAPRPQAATDHAAAVGSERQ